MRKSVQTLVAVALSSAVLAGCGGGNDEYCSKIKDAKSEFGSLSGSPSAIDERSERGFDVMHDLAKIAPDEVSDDWKTLDDSITKLEDALDKAGLKLSDLAKFQQGQVPKDSSAAKLKTLLEEISKINTSQLDSASTAIKKNAKDECDVELG